MINKIKYLLLSCLFGAAIPVLGQTSNFAIDGDNTGCEQLAVDFIDLSTLAEEWTWIFGDGDTLRFDLGNPSPPIVSHTYDEPGTYTVTLIVNGDIEFTLNDTVQVFEPPTPEFSVDLSTVCRKECVQYTDESTPGDGNIINCAEIYW